MNFSKLSKILFIVFVLLLNLGIFLYFFGGFDPFGSRKIAIDDQSFSGSIWVDSIVLPRQGFVLIEKTGLANAEIGEGAAVFTSVLNPGEYRNVEIEMIDPGTKVPVFTSGGQFQAVIYEDTNGNASTEPRGGDLPMLDEEGKIFSTTFRLY